MEVLFEVIFYNKLSENILFLCGRFLVFIFKQLMLWFLGFQIDKKTLSRYFLFIIKHLNESVKVFLNIGFTQLQISFLFHENSILVTWTDSLFHQGNWIVKLWPKICWAAEFFQWKTPSLRVECSIFVLELFNGWIWCEIEE